MGRLRRAGAARRAAVALVAAALLVTLLPAGALGFTGFGPSRADATYGEEMVFSVELRGGAPERLELLLRFAGDEGTFVAPVAADGATATYVWDTAQRHVTPNTSIEYAWRATDGGRVTVSGAATLLYDDDRPGLDWRSARLGEATVHWYGGAEAIARRFGELAAEGTAVAEEFLGHEIAGPVDIFVYDTREEFFGALGPGAREWTGAATYPALRTIFMWLGGGPRDYLETAVVHEVAHVVFNDATDNAFHEPAKWLNEGVATWLEDGRAADERSTVEFEAGGDGLFAFEAISLSFPIGTRGSALAYAQGATMVDRIVEQHGREAIARIAAAYREGASDAEALEAGTGLAADALYDDFFAAFGAEAPQPVEPAPILPSNVRKPDGSGGSVADPSAAPDPDERPAAGDPFPVLPFAVGAVVVVAVAAAAFGLARRRGPGVAAP